MSGPTRVLRAQIGVERAVLQGAIPHPLTTGRQNAGASSSKSTSASCERLRNFGAGSVERKKRLGRSSSSKRSRKP